MSRRIEDRNILLIYGAIFVVGLAYGISISVVSIFLDRGGYSALDIGSLAAWFAGGIVALSLPMGAIIRRFSARASLVACLFGYAAAAIAFPFLPNFTSIAAVRFLDGAFSVGVWVSCETILLSRAGESNKAHITSLYALSLALGYVLGPGIAWVLRQATELSYAFLLSGVLALIAGGLVLARLDPDVREPHEHRAPSDAAPNAGSGVSSLTLLWRIKTSCFATFAYGYFQASVVIFLPLYLIKEKHIAESNTILIPAMFAGGMLSFTNVAGRLGDRYGHLLLMRVLGVVGMTMVLGFVFLDAFVAMCAAVFVAGATLASISPVSLALQGVLVERSEYSRSNAIYNAFYAAGMLLGPPISSRIFGSRGGAPMLYHLAALWVGFVLFTIAFWKDDPAAVRLRSQVEARPAP